MEDSRRSTRLALRWLEGTLLLVAVSGLAVVALLAWGGEPLRGWFPAGNPRPRLAVGLLALLGWHVARTRRLEGRVAWGRIGARLALLAFSSGLTLAGAEWILRHHHQRSQGFGTLDMLRRLERGEVVETRSRHPVSELITLSPNRRLIYELRRNMDKPFGPVRVISNAAGLRDRREFAGPPSDGVVRILGIGDSGIFGWDVEQDETYLARLETSLNQGGGSAVYEVLNAGVPGYNSQQEVEWLASYGLALRPNVVVVGWCNNDFDAPFFLYRPTDYLGRRGSLLYDVLFRRNTPQAATRPDVSMYTGFKRDEIDPEVLGGMGVEGVRAAFARLASLAAKHGFTPLVFGPIPPDVAKLCGEAGLSYFSTIERISDDRYPAAYGVHHMHPSVDGHRVLAQHLLEALRDAGMVEAP